MWTPIDSDPSQFQNPPSIGQNPMAAPQSWNQDFSSQMNAMVAPYRQMSNQMLNNGYAALPGNSGFAQNHPGIARPMDSALLAMSMTKPGQTIGENIANVAGGLVGAQQFRRNQMMQSAMLPYEMAQPRLNMMNTLAQMNERASEIPYRHSMEERNQAMSEWYARRMQQPNATSVEEITAMRKVGINDLNTMTPDQATRFEQEMNAQRQRSSEGAGLTLGRIVQMQLSDDDATKKQGIQAGKIWTAMQGSIAGTQAGARTAVEQPNRNMDEEVKNAYKNYQPTKPMSSKEFYDQFPNVMASELTNPKLAGQGYNSYVSGVQDKNASSKATIDRQVNQYRNWAKSNPNGGFQDFLAQQNGNGPSTGGGDMPPNPFRTKQLFP
jgi:hypothetical protein